IVVNNPKVTLDNNTGETRIRATGNNKALNDGVYVKTYAVYAKDDSSNEILYGITVSPNPNYLPEYDGVTPQAVTYSYKVNISNTSNITFINSNDIYVSDTDLAEALQPYAKTVDVNQQLDKKVNIADMRKPASDVAGIEEVNAKQDKIGYTPADDSKVVHDNHDGTISINENSFTPAILDSAAGKNAQPIDTDVDTLAKPGLYYVSESAPNNPFKALMMMETKIQYDWNHFEEIQISYELENKSGIAVRWVNPKGNLTGFNAASPWMFLSDDSKVAHLSGANNFDTVPTVNNNPLLLASSLPSDLARTGSNQEFTGKNTFDTAPIDKTTGNPYITKDGVPSDLARTGQAQTFTQPQTFSIAPVINDASQDKGDNQAATMADLKSVENSAWHQLDEKKTALGGTLIYKIDQSSKTIYMLYLGDNGLPINRGTSIADFSSIVNNIKTISGKFYRAYASGDSDSEITSSDLSISRRTSIIMSENLRKGPGSYSDFYSGFSDGAYFTYDSLR
ncbi:hypothetical protein ABQ284_02100, partial [Lentilactobacillus buchneri]